MAYLPMRRSPRLQGLPPEVPPTAEEREGVNIDRPVKTDPSIEGIMVNESG